MTGRPEAGHRAEARQGRVVAVVIAVTMLLWLAGNWAGPKLGLHQNYAILFDLAALAAFFWALVVTWRIWRRQSSSSK
ncbi:MAG: hypothetical protein RLZZ528_2202 [Pseudomonadota bacterium]|jgi:hypothetical protein